MYLKLVVYKASDAPSSRSPGPKPRWKSGKKWKKVEKYPSWNEVDTPSSKSYLSTHTKYSSPKEIITEILILTSHFHHFAYIKIVTSRDTAVSDAKIHEPRCHT